MFHSSHHKNIIFLAITAASCIFLLPSRAQSEIPTSFCETSTPVVVNETLLGSSRQAGEQHLFELQTETPGVLLLEVTSSNDSKVQPRLGFLGQACSSSPAIATTRIEQSASHQLLYLDDSGSHTFRVAAQDSRQVLENFKVRSRFVALDELAELTAGNQPPRRDYEYVDPDPGASLPFPERKDYEYVDPDPGASLPLPERKDYEYVDPDPGASLPFPERKDYEYVDPDPGASLPWQAWLRSALCRQFDDTRICARPVAVGEPVTGQISDDWDDDVIAFSIDRMTTLSVRTLGADVTGSLYDQRGQRLARDDSDRGLHMQQTLSPGTYYVRIEGHRGTTGHYGVRVESIDW